MNQLLQDIHTIATVTWTTDPRLIGATADTAWMIRYLHEEYALDFGEDVRKGATLAISEHNEQDLWIRICKSNSVEVNVYRWGSPTWAPNSVRIIRITTETQVF